MFNANPGENLPPERALCREGGGPWVGRFHNFFSSALNLVRNYALYRRIFQCPFIAAVDPYKI